MGASMAFGNLLGGLRARHQSKFKTERRSWASFPWATPRAAKASPPYPLVSVILPVFNHGDLLRESIDSVLSESRYPVELIVVDDGSTDDSVKVVESYSREQRVRLVRQANLGLAGALNTGFLHASGEFQTWTSADNRYAPGALGALADFLMANPQIGVVYANIRLIDEHGRALREASYRSQDRAPHDPSVRLLPCQSETLSAWSDNFINAAFLMRAHTVATVGGYKTQFRGYEDYDFWLRARVVTSFAHLDSDEPLYEYRLHDRSLTAEIDTARLREGQLPLVINTARRLARLEEGELPRVVCFERRSHAGAPALDGVVELLGERCDRRELPLEADLAPGSDWALALSLAGGEARPLHFAVLPPQDPILHLRHSSHARYLRRGCCGLFSPPTDERSAGALLIPPVLELPPLLRRARDGSHGAIPDVPAQSPALLLFVPDSWCAPDEERSWMETATELVTTRPEVVWALVVRTAAQRLLAESLVRLVGPRGQLRVLDHSAEVSGDWRAPSATSLGDEPEQERSLMFALSAADGIAEILLGDAPFSRAELLVTLGIAAAARLPVLGFPAGVARREGVPCGFQELVITAPHLFLVNDLRRATVERDTPFLHVPALGSVEQWLGRLERRAVREALLRMLVLHSE